MSNPGCERTIFGKSKVFNKLDVSKEMKKNLIILFLIAIGPISISNACSIRVQTYNNHTVIKGCKDIEAVYRIIEETIYVGAPIYNEGNPFGCFLVYEGAAYKILNKYGGKCKDVKKILEAGLKTCNDFYTASDKAWVLRKAFDTILGVPTIKGTK